MSAMIQIRNVPDSLHQELKIRAARAGMTLTEYLLREITQVAQRPTVEDLIASVRTRSRPDLTESPTKAVRAERAARG